MENIEITKGKVLPKKDSLSKEDWNVWAKQTLLYNILPLLIVFFTSLNDSYVKSRMLPSIDDVLLAFNAMYGSMLTVFLASMINLVGKYKSGV